ncbi:hypothetical protein CSUI_007928, partial [Cystoisospora suis]
ESSLAGGSRLRYTRRGRDRQPSLRRPPRERASRAVSFASIYRLSFFVCSLLAFSCINILGFLWIL